MNRPPFAPHEWYHCYTRGVDRRQTFISEPDYRRFIHLLFLANDTESVNLRNLTHQDVFAHKHTERLVRIAAYCLMPNHFHLLLQEEKPGGISTFMRKVGTGFTMYFNKKYQRIGNLFVKPFRSRHISDDLYAQRVVPYIHLNPLDLSFPGWNEKHITETDTQTYAAVLEKYEYSSLLEYIGTVRAQSALLDEESINFFQNYQQNKTLQALIEDAKDFLIETKTLQR